MDVRDGIRPIRRLWLAAGLALGLVASAQADPIYNAIDLGTGNVTYGSDASGNGTVIGSNGLTYAFNPSQNDLPAQWSNTTQGVPTVEAAPTWDQFTYGNPKFAYSLSNLIFMNGAGLAAGINVYGVLGHLGNGEAFVVPRQPDGSWGTPGALWSGDEGFAGANGNGAYNVGIMGVSANGHVLGYGAETPYTPSMNVLYLYDSKTGTTTNLTNLINSMKWTDATQLPMGQSPYWHLWSISSRIDNQGQILVWATEGFMGTPHNLLLVPEGVSSDPIATPEPTAWAVFATLIGGWVAHRRLRARPRS